MISRASETVGSPVYSSDQQTLLCGDDGLIATFKVKLNGDQGGEGEVKVKLHPEWAPRGVQRFKELVRIGELENAAVFHVTEDAAHFGLPAEPTLEPTRIKDDIVRVPNKRGTLTFNQGALDGRVNEVFINRNDNTFLDRRGYAPIGEVVDGMDIVDKLYAGYGKRPNRHEIKLSGNEYLDQEFPKLSKIAKVDVTDAN